jgi:hypothetical protein
MVLVAMSLLNNFKTNHAEGTDTRDGQNEMF